MVQDQPVFDWLKFPLIQGNDVAGEVTDVGSAVTRFKRGDRVLAFPMWLNNSNNAEGGFQEYVVIQPVVAAAIPDSLSYTDAATFPLGVSTAASALFQRDYLGLQFPSVSPKPTGKTLLVWGGSSSVGSNAIQLAVAAGYKVVATASASNFDHVKNLGASAAFDYKSPTIVDDLVAVLKPTDFAGVFQTAGSSMDATMEVASKAKNADADSVFIASSIMTTETTPPGVEAKLVWAASIKDNDVAPAVFERFLPRALAEGSYVPAPKPWVVGHGLESVQAGFDAQKKGVSAKKVVVVR